MAFGLTGVWFTELFFMCVSVFFAWKTALFFGNKLTAFLGVVCAFVVFQSFFYEVAGTEEYSLPFMMVSLYIFTKYFFTKKGPPFCEIIILGICFAISVFIRINHFALWFGFCFIIALKSVLTKQWTQLLKYTAGFTAGIIIVSIPVLLYLTHNNALSDYINQNFLVGSSRAFTGFSIKGLVNSFLEIMYKNFCYIPLASCFLWLVKTRKIIPLFYTLGFLLAYLSTIFFLAVIRTDFDHYNILLAPFLVPAFVFCVNLCFAYFKNSKGKNIIVMCFLCIIFSKEIISWVNDIFKIASHKDKMRNELITAGKTIDRFTRDGDTVISLGFPCRLYIFTERQSASRYIYQTSGAAFAPGMQEEFLSDLQRNSPALIAIQNQDDRYDYLPDWFAPVYEMIAEGYRLLSDENGFYLFVREKE
jgi:hypothetical protein